MPLCVARVTSEDLYPSRSNIGLAVYGGPQEGGATFLDLAYDEEFNMTLEGLVISLEVRAPSDEMPILVGLESEPAPARWAAYALCVGESAELILSIEDITGVVPANDLLGNAADITLDVPFSVDLSNATSPYSDPGLGVSAWPSASQLTRTAWYQWTAPSDDLYSVDTLGSACLISEESYLGDDCGDSIVGVYRVGVDDELTFIAYNDDCRGDDVPRTRLNESLLSCLVFEADEGDELYFVVGSYDHHQAYLNVRMVVEEASVPLMDRAPRITSGAVVRAMRTVEVSRGVWLGSGPQQFSFQWYECPRRVGSRVNVDSVQRTCAPIADEEGDEFTPSRAQARQYRGRFLLAVITVQNDVGTVMVHTGTTAGAVR